MTNVSRWAIVCFLVLVSVAFSQNNAGQTVSVIHAGVLIDGKSDRPRRDQVIVIRGNWIESVSDAANAKIPAGAGSGNVSVVVQVGGVASQANITVAVR